MNEIKAFIKPNKLESVVEALKENGFKSVTLSESEGTGTYKREDSLPSLKFHFTDSKMIKLELVCQNEEAEKRWQLFVKMPPRHILQMELFMYQTLMMRSELKQVNP